LSFLQHLSRKIYIQSLQQKKGMGKKHLGIVLQGGGHKAFGQHALPAAVIYLLLAFVCLFQKEEEKFEAWQALHGALHPYAGLGPALEIAPIEKICQTLPGGLTELTPDAVFAYFLDSTMNRPSMRRPISVYS
jgi:hypothetical protein